MCLNFKSWVNLNNINCLSILGIGHSIVDNKEREITNEATNGNENRNSQFNEMIWKRGDTIIFKLNGIYSCNPIELLNIIIIIFIIWMKFLIFFFKSFLLVCVKMFFFSMEKPLIKLPFDFDEFLFSLFYSKLFSSCVLHSRPKYHHGEHMSRVLLRWYKYEFVMRATKDKISWFFFCFFFNQFVLNELLLLSNDVVNSTMVDIHARLSFIFWKLFRYVHLILYHR